MILLAIGCVPPTVYGLRFDGTMPANTELSVAASTFPDFLESEGTTLADTSILGLEGRQRLGNDFGVTITAGTAPYLLVEDNPVLVGGLAFQGRVLNERPITVGIVGGIEGYGMVGADGLTPGVHLGAVVSRGVGAFVRPYLGVQVNPVFVQNAVYPWMLYSGGMSWRPQVATATRGLLALEGTVYQGFGVAWNTADDPAPSDLLTWGLLLQVGVSFGSDPE